MKLKFDKDMTLVLKGVCIIMMVTHHCAGGEVLWNVPLKESNSIIEKIMSMCSAVGIYTFMVGYGYAFAKKKDFKDTFNRIVRLLIPFWVILFLFTIPVAYSSMNLQLFILNMFGINSVYNWFSWFVSFYIFSMIVLPLIGKLIDNKPVVWGGVFIALFFIMEVAVHELYPNYSANDFSQRLFDCCLRMPGLIIGYIFSKKKWFTTIEFPNLKFTYLWAVGLFALVFVLRDKLGGFLGFNFDFFYAPLTIFSVLMFFNINKLPITTKILKELGKVSVYMWFFHALFFTEVTRSFYQPIVAISNYLWINTIWTIIVTFACSWCLLKAQQFVEKKLKSNR